ncbi:MAG: polyprenyl diphosphate synthase [Thermoleophilia bacterium]
MTGWRNLLANLRRDKTDSEDFLLTADQPRYVAVIMDGNGRWAARRHLPAIAGHREGARALKRVIRSARRLRIKELTVYAFSTENWQRPQDEVDALMSMFSELIDKEVPELDEQDVRVRFIGRRAELSTELREKMDWAQQLTADNGTMTLFVAFNYGGRAELEDAARSACAEAAKTGAAPDLSRFLYAPEMHDPQLLIRTSGEQRVSNFLLWQCAYSELYFSDRLWPEFDEADLVLALDDFQQRQRRFGGR